MALSGKIRTQFQQLHGLSLKAASESLFAASDSLPVVDQTAPVDTTEISGRGTPNLTKSVDPDEKDRQNRKILSAW